MQSGSYFYIKGFAVNEPAALSDQFCTISLKVKGNLFVDHAECSAPFGEQVIRGILSLLYYLLY